MSNPACYESERRRMVILSNADGEIVAAADAVDNQLRYEQESAHLTTGIAALPGQGIHVVDCPVGFSRLTAVEKHRWLASHRLAFGPEPHIVRNYGVAGEPPE